MIYPLIIEKSPAVDKLSTLSALSEEDRTRHGDRLLGAEVGMPGSGGLTPAP